VNINITNKLPVLRGNDFRLKQLFQNLIQNALKYNDKEHIIIEISSTEKEQEYLFQIKDNGMGIPQAYQYKIFDIFLNYKMTITSGIGFLL
jgi:light-regulated signal transduction histidine kinase (bacteriophytochrome)